MKGIEVVWLSQTDLTNLNAGEGEANFIDIKKYKKNGVEYPYVSGQAMRYYFKEAIRRNLAEDEYICVFQTIRGRLAETSKIVSDVTFSAL